MRKCALVEGMGSEIPIKFAGYAKATKWVLSYAGGTCSACHEFKTSKKELPIIIAKKRGEDRSVI